MKKIFLFTLIIISCSLFSSNKKKILILNSYHLGYPWTNSITNGILAETKKDNHDFYFEFLDTKRFISPSENANIHRYLEEKYKDISLDAIITIDDYAYELVHKNRFFKEQNTPVFFCGVNDTQTVYKDENDTGIIETIGVKETVYLANQLRKISKIYIISDNTITGKYLKKVCLQEINIHYPRLDVVLLDKLTYDKVPETVSNLEEDSCIFLLTFFRDAAGNYNSAGNSASIVTKNANVPVYSFWDFYLPYNITGGYIIKARDIGNKIIKLLKTYFEQNSMQNLNTIRRLDGEFYIHYNEAATKKLNTSNLKIDVNFLDKPESIMDLSLKQFIIMMLIIFTNLVAIIALILLNQSKKKNAEIIHKSDAFLKKVFNNMPSVLVAFDPSFIITNWSDYAEKQFKISHNNAVGNNLFHVLQDLTIKEADIRKMVAKSEKLTINKFQFHLDDMESVLTNLVFYPVETSFMKRFVLRIDNISNQIRLEEIMVQTDKMTALTGMAAGVAHELNNPLAGIIQSVQIIENKEKKLEHESMDWKDAFEKMQIKTFHSYILKSARQASNIINSLIQFSRSVADVKTSNSINDMVTKTLHFASNDYHLKKNLQYKMIHVEPILKQNLPVVGCISQRIEQALFNIIKNAAEAVSQLPKEQPTITIATNIEDHFITITVKDNGIGISQSNINRVFDPFFTTKKDIKAPGLGLSVAYFIIHEQHEGNILIHSELGIGTEVKMLLPLQEKE